MRLSARTRLSTPRSAVFPFFADAGNLQGLTPPWLHFSILTPQPIDVRAGTRIRYRIWVHGVPLTWESEISAYHPPDWFVDEQRRGPYRHWIHTHRFKDVPGGTLLADDVDFVPRCRGVTASLVARDLRRIFSYRHSALLRLFDEPLPWPDADIQVSR